MSKEALVEDIREDIRVSKRSLEREAYRKWQEDGWLFGEGVEKGEVVKPPGAGQKDEIAMCQMEN